MPLDPQAQQFIDALKRDNVPGWNELTPREGRKTFNGLTELFGTGPDVAHVENRTIASGVPVRVYRPSNIDGQAVLVYFHGGGWVLGNLDTHDAFCRRLAAESSAVVVAVDYRLAPENRYPGALDDCFAVTLYVADNAAEFSADAARLALIGDSAGGNLAAAIALKARDQGGPAIRAQILVVPVMSPACDTASYRDFAEGYGLTKADMQWFWQQYTGGHSTPHDAYAAPPLAADLCELPTAHIVTAEYDVLRDEGEAYAARLTADDVPTTTRRYDGMIHGFMHFWSIFDAGNRAVSDVAAVAKAMTADED